MSVDIKPLLMPLLLLVTEGRSEEGEACPSSVGKSHVVLELDFVRYRGTRRPQALVNKLPVTTATASAIKD